MSLDVYLKGSLQKVSCRCYHCGNTHTTEEAEWLYTDNITHNLTDMAREAGIDKHLWHPNEIGITKASQLINPLKKALKLMKSDRPRFEKFNASNGWGLYIHFVPFIEKYLKACEKHPKARVAAHG